MSSIENIFNGMLKKQLAILLLFFLLFSRTTGQHIYDTQPLTDEIKTIQLRVNEDVFQPPVIHLNSADRITLSFDKLSVDEPRLRYRLIHCYANWIKDNLSAIEYLDGFDDQLIENYRFSGNTTVHYIHYSLSFPNEQVRLKISGNYAVEVYDENAPDAPLLHACFSVVEPQVGIRAEVTGNTDIDIHKAHQQLRFEISHPALSLRDPVNEISVTLLQNNRRDNLRERVKPTYVHPNRMVFEHQAALIFEAGNEYRRFETVSRRYNGLGVSRIFYEAPFMQAVLLTDQTRSGGSRQYDEDRNGRFLIRSADAYDSDTEADYFMVHFALEPSPKAGNTGVYLDGGFTYGNPGAYPLHYDGEANVYRTSVLLKQGAYNYRYVTRTMQGFSTEFTEGNYSDTENEYGIMVYYRPPGSRYDKLVGWLNVQ